MGGFFEVVVPLAVDALVSVGTAVGASAATAAVVGASVVAAGVGATMTVVGAVTHNKLVSEIGMGFSAAGALGGLGAMGASAGLFDAATGTEAITGASGALDAAPGGAITAAETGSSGAEAGTAATEAGTVGNQGGAITPAVTGETQGIPGGQALEAGQAPVDTATGAPAQTAADAGQTATTLGQNGPIPSDTGLANTPAPGATPPTAPTPQAIGSPSAPEAPVTSDPSKFTGDVMNPTGTANPQDVSAMQQSIAKVSPVLKTMPDNPAAQPGWWASIDPTVKASILMVAGQTGAGGLGGLFQGMQAQKQLDLQRLIDQENRSQFNQMFARETSSPGLIQFGPTNGKATA